MNSDDYKSEKLLRFLLIFLICQFPPFIAHNLAGDNMKIVQDGLTIYGKVVSFDQMPLPGVNVVEKGTTNGAVTDLDGKYSITVSGSDAILIFSFVGYLQEELPVKGQTEINITMVEDISALDEVVVVGYGSIKKRDIVGSVSTVNTEDLKNSASSASFVDYLQGKAAGLSIQSNSGVPGAQSRVLIRGMNTLHAGSGSPLWIIDGIPVHSYNPASNNGTEAQSPMSLINPNDIESIQVLKDAGATAIYGSRGSNGIILVTTKSGKGGKGTLDINYSTGVSELSRTPEDIGYTSTEEWFAIMDVAAQNEGNEFYDPQFTYNRTPYATDLLTREEALAVNTNWFDQILQQGSYTEMNVSGTSGFEKGNIFLSGNYRKDNSVIKHNDLERYSLRANMNFHPIENLELGTNLNVSHTRNNRMKNSGKGNTGGNQSGNTGGFTSAGYDALPWYPVYNDSSMYYNPLVSNPVANADPNNIKDELTTYRALGSLTAQYNMPFLKGLSVRTEGSFDILQTNQTNWVSADIRDENFGSMAREEAILLKTLNTNLFATYNRVIENHSIVFTAGMEGQRDDGYLRRMEGWDIQGTYQELGQPLTLKEMEGRATDERYLLSYFSRLNYKFKERYILGLSFRRDGSSKFPAEQRWGNFAAVSGGWIISEEDFLSSAGRGTFLKLRGSFGQTGNEAIPSYLFVQTYNTNYLYGSSAIMGRGGTFPSNMVSGLTWEKTNSIDAGIDFGFFDNRVSGSVAYYYKMVDNLLLQTPLPISTGIDGGIYVYTANQAWGNIGQLDNSGFEFEISSVNINTGDFKWTTMFNFGTNRNEIKRLDDDGNNVIGKGYTIASVGGKIGEWYMARYADVDPETGVERIYALDRDHFQNTGETKPLIASDGADSLIYASRSAIQQNSFRLGNKSSVPAFYGGITNAFEYKGIDFSFFVSFSGGNYIFDYDEQVSTTTAPARIIRADVLGNYWEKPGDIAKYPRPMYNTPHEVKGENYDLAREWCAYDKYLYKGDYIRLKNVQLGYTLPSRLLNQMKISKLRIYVSGSNLFTYTDYKGWDPEGATHVYEATIPQLKVYSFGVDLGF